MAKDETASRMKRKDYEKELRKLQVLLCQLQEGGESKQASGHRPLRRPGCGGKGGTIKAITEKVSPRVFSRGCPSSAVGFARRRRLFLQRYMQNFPAAGEIVIFDRSWYNRAGVEYVMVSARPPNTSDSFALSPG